jgi:hypothetical protein
MVHKLLDVPSMPHGSNYCGDLRMLCHRTQNGRLICTYLSPRDAMHRMIDLVHGGQRRAVGDDIVFCRYLDHPRIIAIYGHSWIIQDRGDPASASARAPVTAQQIAYDEQFALADHAGQRLAGGRYWVRIGSNVIASGVADSQGHARRITIEDARRLTLEIGGGV